MFHVWCFYTDKECLRSEAPQGEIQGEIQGEAPGKAYCYGNQYGIHMTCNQAYACKLYCREDMCIYAYICVNVSVCRMIMMVKS